MCNRAIQREQIHIHVPIHRPLHNEQFLTGPVDLLKVAIVNISDDNGSRPGFAELS